MALWTFASSRLVQQLLLATSICFILVQSQTETSNNVPASTFDATATCAMVQNGTFIKDPRACNTWMQCVDGKPVSGTCDNGLFYNRNTNKCVDANTIKCYSSEPCATITTNGFVTDPYSCNGYYYCYSGKGTRGECSTGMNYNPGTGDCVRDFTCPQEPDPESLCNIIPDGEFFASQQSCQDYHICEKSHLETGACPSGYYFNAFSRVCDYKDKVRCTVPEAHPDLSTTGVCQNAGQFVSDNGTCAGYYYCKEKTTPGDFLLIWGQCSDGRFFDPAEGGKCVDRQQIACVYNRCDGINATSIQLVNAPNDGCKGYLICQDGVEIGNGMCPSDEMYYDEVTQRCTTLAVSFPACLVTVTLTIPAATTTTKKSTAADNVPQSTINVDENVTTVSTSAPVDVGKSTTVVTGATKEDTSKKGSASEEN